DVSAPRSLNREPERMVDRAPLDLVVTGEPGEDGEAGGIRRCPAGWPELVRAQAPDRARAGLPAAALGVQRVELVEAARRAVNDDRVPVAGRRAPALDLHVPRDRVR